MEYPKLTARLSSATLQRLLQGRAARGFSLIELMVVFSIFAVLVAVAMPSYTGLMEGTKVSSASAAYVESLQLARSESATRSTNVGLCRSFNVQSTAPTCSGTGVASYSDDDWAGGWLVYSKPRGTALSAYSASTDQLLQRVDPDGGDINPTRLLVMVGAQFLVFGFGPDGTRIGDTSEQRVTFDYRDPSSATPSTNRFCVTVNTLGSTKSSRTAAASC
jgi:prepilin-type N-terminal cleavage/methylation domain-containing protein